jgi:hypothetical protein
MTETFDGTWYSPEFDRKGRGATFTAQVLAVGPAAGLLDACVQHREARSLNWSTLVRFPVVTMPGTVSVVATDIGEKLRYRCVGGGRSDEAIAFQFQEPAWKAE